MMLSKWVSLLAGVFFSNSTLNLHHNGSLLRALSNLLINFTTWACFIFPLSSGGSPNLLQRINSNCLNTGVTFSLLSLRKANSLSSTVVSASLDQQLNLVPLTFVLIQSNRYMLMLYTITN